MITPPRKEEWSYAYSISGRHLTPISVIIGVRSLPLFRSRCKNPPPPMIHDLHRFSWVMPEEQGLPTIWACFSRWQPGAGSETQECPAPRSSPGVKRDHQIIFCEWPRLHNENSLHIVGCYCSYREHFKKMKWYGCDIPPYSCCYAQGNFAL